MLTNVCGDGYVIIMTIILPQSRRLCRILRDISAGIIPRFSSSYLSNFTYFIGAVSVSVSVGFRVPRSAVKH